MRLKKFLTIALEPQSHRIVRFLDRTTASDWAIFAMISSSGRIPRLISTCGRVVTNDWRILMARAIVGNRATSGL